MICEKETVLVSTDSVKLFEQIKQRRLQGWELTDLWQEIVTGPFTTKITVYFAKLTRRNPQFSVTIGPVRTRKV